MKRLLIAGGLVLSLACAKHAEEAAETEGVVVGATVEAVTTERFVETLDASGTVTVRPGHTASLAAPAPTRVMKVLVATGARVHAGDVLVELDKAPFETAAAAADASLAAAQKASERAQRLADAGVGTRRDAEAAAADLARAKAEAQAAKRALDLSTLRSPIDGVVTRLSALLGASADAGQSLVEVSDVSAMDVALTLSVSDASKAHAGQTVALRRGDEAVAAGRVVDVAATVDSASGGVIVRVELASGMNSVRVGEQITGRLTLAEHANAVTVPVDALVPDGEEFHVFVVDENGMAHTRAVTVGGRNDTHAWITEGLKTGERIVTHGAYGVTDSATVETGAQKK